MYPGGIDPLSNLRHVPDTTYDAQHHNYGCLENTRVDILADLDTWARDRQAQPVYWLAGMAGTGKSTVAWSFCQRLAARNLLGGSFFCSRAGLATHADVKRTIPTLVRLLALAHEGFRKELQKQLEVDSDAAYKSIAQQIQLLLQKPLAHPSRYWSDRPDVLVIVIDALDECSDRDATTNMLHALIESSSSLHPLKFFVTSRPEHHIRGTPLSDHNLSRIVKLHEIKRSTVDADIRLFVQDRLSAIRHFDKAWYHSRDITRLTELSNGLFIFASTAVKYIHDGNSAERLRKVVSSTIEPGGPATKPLDNMYQAILEETLAPGVLESNELAFLNRILSFILSMRTTLSVCALAELLRIPPGQLRGHLDLLHAVISIPDDNKSPSLKTLHASFGDFLTDRAPSHMRIDRSAGHQQLLDACFSRMADEDLCFNISRTPSSYFPHPNPEAIVAHISESLRYACLHWPHHLNSVSLPIISIPDIERVFCPKFLFWLELLGLLGRVDKASSLVSTVIKTINLPFLDISHFLQDAIAFIESSREVAQLRAPHIYLSVLPSTPSGSLIFKTFYYRFKQLPLMKPEAIIETMKARLHHDNSVQSRTFSPNGMRIVSGSIDKTIRAWDVHTKAELLSPLTGHDGKVNSVAFSADGMRIVSGSDDKMIQVWDTRTGAELLSPLIGHDGWVRSVGFSPDGTNIVSGSCDKTIRVWDAHTGAELLPPLTGHDGWVNSVAFSSDGTRIVSGSDDKTIRLWDARTGAELLSPLIGHNGWVNSVVFSPDGMRIVSGSDDKTIRVWDTRTGAELLSPLIGHDGRVKSVAVSLDGTRIVSGSNDKTIRVWDTHTGAELLSPLTVRAGWSNSVRVSLDGARIVSGSDDKTIRVRDTHTGAELLPPLIGHSGWANSVSFSPDGTRIVSGSDDKTIRVWDVHTGEEFLSPLTGHHGWILSLAFSPDGKYIVSGSLDKTIRVWNAHAGAEPLLSSIINPISQSCLLSHDRKWIKGRSGEHLFWIPPEYRRHPIHIQIAPCILLIGKYRVVVDFTACGSAHGTNWTQCFVG